MFNTEIIRLLQGFDYSFIYWLMEIVSFLGTTPMIIIVSLGIAFGLDLKRGLVLLNIVAWTAFISTLLKVQIDFPRPIDIDPTIQNEKLKVNTTDLSDRQPDAFFELFSKDLLAITRTDKTENYGFPSGHVAIQTSLWLSFFLLFRRRWIVKWAIGIILLTALSRLYLGHHFLADVLGGGILGVAVPLIILYFIRKSKYLQKQTHDRTSLLFFWLPWLALPFAAFIPYWQMAGVLGLNMAVIYIVQKRNFPVFHVISWKRAVSALLVIIFYLAAFYFHKFVHFTNSAVLDFFLIVLLNFLTIRGVLSLNRRLFLIKYRLGF